MARIRSLTARLGNVFAETQQPAYVLDDQRRIVYCNDACVAWTNTAITNLIGLRCDYHNNIVGQVPSSIAAGLCPSPDALLGNPTSTVVSCPQAEGRLSRRIAWVIPITGEESSAHTLVLVSQAELAADTVATAQLSESAALQDQIRQIRNRIGLCYRVDQLLGVSPQIRRIRDQIRFAMSSRARVLIVGPTGSGCQHVARTIHYANNPDSAPPILVLSGPLIDREMLQATLPTLSRRGPDSPRSSTLLVTDVELLTPDAQDELSNYLRLPTFELRLLCTARNSLIQLADQQTFRSDLAFALSTFVIEIPPLQQHPKDIPLLAQHFLAEFNSNSSKQLSGFVPEAVDKLVKHEWKRNIDELIEVVNESCQRAEGVWVTTADLPEKVHSADHASRISRKSDDTVQLDDFLIDVERELIRRALNKARGNKAKAARFLGVSRPRLLRRIVQLGLAEATDIIEIPFEEIEEGELSDRPDHSEH